MEQKERYEERKILKREGKLAQGVGALKSGGGAGTPLRLCTGNKCEIL